MPDPDNRRPSAPETPARQAGTGTNEAAAQGGKRTPVPRRRSGPKALPRKRTGVASRALIDTSGPLPMASLSEIRLTIGTIGGTHGIEGELKLRLLTDQPDHLPTLTQVFLGSSDEPTRLERVRFHGDQALIKLEGIDSPEQGKALGGLQVRIAGEDARPLGPDEYFLFQLIGLRAVDEHGSTVGVVTDLIETGAHDVLVITPPDGDRTSQILIPNHPQFVTRIAPEAGVIRVILPQYQERPDF